MAPDTITLLTQTLLKVILPKNSRIPACGSKTFALENAFQKGVTIEVFEGESELARENSFMCRHDILLPELSQDEAEANPDMERRRVTVTFKVAAARTKFMGSFSSLTRMLLQPPGLLGSGLRHGE